MKYRGIPRLSRAQRVLPPTWRGVSRAAQWHRARARRVLSAVLLLICGSLVWSALQPAASASESMLVAARDLSAGHRIGPSDLQSVSWPRGTHLRGALTRPVALGALTVAAIDAGEPLTSSRITVAGRWPGVASGNVVVSVPSVDPSVTELVRSGDRVDVIGPQGSVGTALPVVLVSRPTGGSGFASSAATAGALWVSAPSTVAARIASATIIARTSGAGLTVVLRPAP